MNSVSSPKRHRIWIPSNSGAFSQTMSYAFILTPLPAVHHRRVFISALHVSTSSLNHDHTLANFNSLLQTSLLQYVSFISTPTSLDRALWTLPDCYNSFPLRKPCPQGEGKTSLTILPRPKRHLPWVVLPISAALLPFSSSVRFGSFGREPLLVLAEGSSWFREWVASV